MKKALSLTLAICAFCFNLACAEGVSSEELIKDYRLYEGKEVVFAGEVVGDVMLRGEYAWVNLNDGINAIGVWVKAGLARQIQYSGSYKAQGEWSEVKGIFNHSCPLHGGDLDIHAESLRRVEPGTRTEERLDLNKRKIAFIFAAILCLIWILSLLNRK